MKVAVAGQEEKVQNYAAALAGVGLRAVITLDAAAAADCAGLLLPGGGDIDPARFGQENRGSENIDPALDGAQFSLLDAFVRAKKPVLGICRGHQVLNVYFGGSLIQHLATAPEHMAHDRQDSVHPAENLPGSALRALYGPRMAVNSSHHQGLRDMGRGLRAVSFAPDGTVEAIQHESLPILGVQFHPERMCFAKARPDAADGGAVFRWWKELL